MWINHPHFASLVENHWNSFVSGTKQFILFSKLKSLKGPLKELNKKEFSHISERAKKANLDFQTAVDDLDVTVADAEARNNVHHLRQQAQFLAGAERHFFGQKLKTKHLIAADRGSKYFHALVKNKNRVNSINRVIDSSGNLTTSIEQVGAAFVEHFQNIFGHERNRIPCCREVFSLGNILTPEDCTNLIKPISDSEIKEAIFSMGDDKAPGPDGYSAAFFKRNWELVGHLVQDAVQEFFRFGRLLKQWNHTIIALIPKSDVAQSVSDFRHISCCNVVYKIITKILASRMAPILPTIIDPAQGAFVEGRSISDNIFLAQELIRGYNRKRSSKSCMIMVDLRKAYDIVDWMFLYDVLHGLGFPIKFIGWIRECISTASFSVSVNGSLFGLFPSKCGLRQGDPMSPMLFTLCIEYFSRLLTQKIRFSGFRFHPKCRGLRITHLAYVDDLMLFYRADERSVSILLQALNDFEATSGLTVNLDKSNIFLAGVLSDRFHLTGLLSRSLPVRYLGVPLHAQRLTSSQFAPLLRSITKLIEYWK